MVARSLQFLEHRLEVLHSQHLYRQLRTIQSGSEAWITIEGQRVLNLSSNNYLGLASHPALYAAAMAAAKKHSCSTGSSRLIAGSDEWHQTLETRFAQFKGAESSLLFNSGYNANIGVISALAGVGDLILSDELNHASIIDGCRLSRATCKIYPHGDVAALATLLESSREQADQIFVITDTVFSMDGDLAPLGRIVELCRRYEAILIIDEAHATGCVGPGGRGLLATCDSVYEATISICTLSKALGSFGALVVGPTLVKEYLINRARSFLFTTALPVPVVAASLAALSVLEQTPELTEQLQENASFFRKGLQDLGFHTLTSQTQIIPILISDDALALEMMEELLHNGIFAVAIRPPTVPTGTSRIRVSLMAQHSQESLTFALEMFERVGKRLNII
jgi:8-amino-7-oxononanoate synthase